LNKIALELENLYEQQFNYILNQTPEGETPVWKQTDIAKLTQISKQLELVNKIRNNCQQIYKDLELLKSYSSS
jgi:hypothetical protein